MPNYRVWYVINPPNDPFYQTVGDPETGANWIKWEIYRQAKIERIWGNAFGLEVDDGSGWTEWYNEVGEDVNEAFGLE